MTIFVGQTQIEQNKVGVLGTVRSDGSPHVVVVLAAVVEGRLWISTPRTTVKVRNVERDPRVVFEAGVRPWVAIAGTGRVVTEELPAKLRTYYRAAAGEHPDWNDYDRAMIAEQRVLIEITPERVYGS